VALAHIGPNFAGINQRRSSWPTWKSEWALHKERESVFSKYCFHRNSGGAVGVVLSHNGVKCSKRKLLSPTGCNSNPWLPIGLDGRWTSEPDSGRIDSSQYDLKHPNNSAKTLQNCSANDEQHFAKYCAEFRCRLVTRLHYECNLWSYRYSRRGNLGTCPSKSSWSPKRWVSLFDWLHPKNWRNHHELTLSKESFLHEARSSILECNLQGGNQTRRKFIKTDLSVRRKSGRYCSPGTEVPRARRWWDNFIGE
jgi:hypothetical protein